jgi:hypothetical protein
MRAGEAVEEVLVDAQQVADDDEVVDLEEAIVEPVDDEDEGEEEDEAAEAAAEVEAARIDAELEREARAGTGEEALLDVLLRTTGVLPDEPEVEAVEEEGELPTARRANEFVCSGCFLIKPRNQLADAERRVCRDCVDPPAAARSGSRHAA